MPDQDQTTDTRRDLLRLYRALGLVAETDIDDAVDEATAIYDERHQLQAQADTVTDDMIEDIHRVMCSCGWPLAECRRELDPDTLRDIAQTVLSARPAGESGDAEARQAVADEDEVELLRGDVRELRGNITRAKTHLDTFMAGEYSTSEEGYGLLQRISLALTDIPAIRETHARVLAACRAQAEDGEQALRARVQAVVDDHAGDPPGSAMYPLFRDIQLALRAQPDASPSDLPVSPNLGERQADEEAEQAATEVLAQHWASLTAATEAPRSGKAASWACPNTPGCAHPSFVHDVFALEDQRPVCCAEGCLCARPAPAKEPGETR